MKHFLFMLFCALTSAVVFAQEGGGDGAKLDVNITKNDGGGSFPWLWIVGGIVFVVLLIALLGGGGRDRVVEKRTIIKE